MQPNFTEPKNQKQENYQNFFKKSLEGGLPPNSKYSYRGCLAGEVSSNQHLIHFFGLDK
jgi:hypothetical protein